MEMTLDVSVFKIDQNQREDDENMAIGFSCVGVEL